MLVEHTFITTLEPQVAFSRASLLLDSLGFENHLVTAIGLRASRGGPKQSRRLAEMPLEVRINYDRGRVSLAASLTAYRQKELPIYETLLLTLARALEHAMTVDVPMEEDIGRFQRVEASRKSVWLPGEIVGFVVLGLVGLLVAVSILVIIIASIVASS